MGVRLVIAELAAIAPDVDLEGLAAPAVAHYDFGPDSAVDLVNVSENATFRVCDPATGRTAFLRAHRNGYHTLQEIASELAWAAALRTEAGVTTPMVVKTRGGADIVILRGAPLPDERYCVMFEELPGSEPPDGELTEWCSVLGERTARMHKHAAAWTPPAWFSRPTWDLDTITGAMGRWGRWQDSADLDPDARSVLHRAEAKIRGHLDGFGRSADRYGLIHADMRLGNTLADGDALALIDFDDCGYGWFLWDLATVFTFIEHRPDVPDAVDAWLGGYRRVFPLASGSDDVIPDLLMLRRLQVLAWLAWHAETPLAQAESADYTGRTLELADRYLQEEPG